MWCAALAGCVAVLGTLQFTGTKFEVEGEPTKFLIKVTDDDLTCGSADEDQVLKAQYNLGSIFIPGVSPLAYHKVEGSQNFEYIEPGSSRTKELPEWWKNQSTSNLYKLINSEKDSLVLTGMFIPEVSPH